MAMAISESPLCTIWTIDPSALGVLGNNVFILTPDDGGMVGAGV